MDQSKYLKSELTTYQMAFQGLSIAAGWYIADQRGAGFWGAVGYILIVGSLMFAIYRFLFASEIAQLASIQGNE